ncbi:uncharacterized protein LOC122005795 isoform X1 [Zingiber officinale]|uniref:uncharacterized protein LOC122005795 isoform X1 n=1 Tax=Zingiber officinale TaxID=94328 RepID=UPI001C4B83A2|nr:uncharacterized protein LOC122005795 isoform X1 [Zingiber officinale]
MAAARAGVIQILEARLPPSPWIPSRAATIRLEQIVVDEVEEGGGALLSLRSIRRRALLWLALPSLAAVVAPSAASALSLGIPGPKDWLREQKKKSAKFVLAPIEASRETLRSAYGLLSAESQGEKSQEVIRLLNLASRDCVPQQRNTLVQLQSQTGVEVCTFRLVVKNAASLLDKDDLVKLEAEASLDDLIRSFSFLGNMMTDCNFQIETDREKLRDGLMDTISSLDRFEQGIKNCLGV